MERLVTHLQQIATRDDLAQFHQWLCTYMLYVQSGTPPTVEVVPHDPRVPLLQGLRWKGTHLMVPDRALQEVPARPLALLAARGYLEAQARRRLTLRSVFLTLLILFTVPPLLFHIAPPTPSKAYHWLLHLLVVVPIERTWAWQRKIARLIDREVLTITGETDVLLDALITAVKVDIRVKGADRTVADMIGRLNALRKERGYAEVTMEELLPPLPPEDGEQEQISPAIDKGEFLYRHPPDEYRRVDKIRI